MEIQNYRPGDEHQILNLFELAFGRPMQLAYWEWRFNNNPAGKHMIKLMWEGKKLIGHYAVSPVFLSLENSKILSTLSMATMTHPKFGGMGIFGQLANALYEELENNLNVKAIWGYPNNNSHYGFIKNLKWFDLGQQSHLIVKAEKIKAESIQQIGTFLTFTDEHANLIITATSQFPVAVIRNKEYLNWRYVDNPTSVYDKFEYRQGNELIGFVVVKKYPSSVKPGIFDLYLTEIGFTKENAGLIKPFLTHIVSFYNQPEATINTWISLFDNRYIHFEKAGFQPGGKPTYIGVRPGDFYPDTLKDFRNWYLSYGDSDIY